MKPTCYMITESLDLPFEYVQKPPSLFLGVEGIEKSGSTVVCRSSDGSAVLSISSPDCDAAGLLQEAHTTRAAISDWYERLLMAALDHVPLPDFLGICAERLANPIAAFASDGTVLATAGAFLGPIGGTIWEHLGSGALDWSYYAPSDQRMLHQSVPRTTRPYLFRPKSDPEHEYLGAFVRHEGKLVASVGLVDINSPHTSGQVETVNQIAHMLGLYLSGNGLYLRLAQKSASLLSELISGGEVAPQTVRHWLDEQGLTTFDRFCIAALVPCGDGEESHGASHLKSAVERLVRNSIACENDGALAVLVGVEQEASPAEVADTFEKAFSRLDAAWGASPIFRDVTRTATYFAQARLACEMDGGTFVEAYPNVVFSALVKTHPYETLIDPTVLDCMAIGDAGSTILESLRAYLLHGGNIASAAQSLYVHRNTLVYRLGKAERSLGIDLDALSDRQRFYYLMSCELALRGKATQSHSS